MPRVHSPDSQSHPVFNVRVQTLFRCETENDQDVFPRTAKFYLEGAVIVGIFKKHVDICNISHYFQSENP